MARFAPVPFTTRKGSKLILRSPEVGEGEALLKMALRTLAASPHVLTQPDELTLTVEQENDFIRSHLEHPSGVLICPFAGDQPVGILNFVTGRRRRIAHLGELGMSVAPEYQGQGVGRALLESLISWARANPTVEKLHLRVHADNTPAFELYKKLGFRVEGTDARGIKTGEGRYSDVHWMGLFVK